MEKWDAGWGVSLLCPGLEQGCLEGMPGEARLPVEEARTRAMQVRVVSSFFQIKLINLKFPCRQWSTTMLLC